MEEYQDCMNYPAMQVTIRLSDKLRKRESLHKIAEKDIRERRQIGGRETLSQQINQIQPMPPRLQECDQRWYRPNNYNKRNWEERY